MINFLKITLCIILTCFQAISKYEFVLDKEHLLRRYSPRDKNEKIKICVVVHNIGRNSAVANTILNIIPSKFSMSISPYHKMNKSVLDKIRLHNHELLLVQPMANLVKKEDHQDPYRINIYYSSEQNNKIMEQSLRAFLGCECAGIAVEQWSVIFNHEDEVQHMAQYLKKEGKFLFLPQMCAEHTLYRLCKKHKVNLLEADYYFMRSLNIYKVRKKLIEAKKLADATGWLIIAVEENIQNIKTIVDWLLELPKRRYEIVQLADLCEYGTNA